MLRILLVIIVGFFIYRLFKTKGLTWPEFKTKKTSSPELKPEPLVQDPICKTYLVKEKAIESDSHFFCSEKCRKEFIAASKET